ncbi:MAG: UDP-N-acetylglucosamine 2-epimerase (non-hydrolyzing) [Terriglobales bacterium]
MKVILVVGARPNFMKAAPILRAITQANRHSSDPITPVLVHTGQHYDAAMSDAFFVDLNLQKPDINLGVGPGSHAWQTAEVMKKFETVLNSERPDIVIVVGDVNSTVACALVTAKISGTARPLLAHVEAGLRSFDRSMPEECNRVVTDHLSDLLFVTEESGLRNLENEGISKDGVFFVGNTMIDSLLACHERARKSAILTRLGLLRSEACNGSPRAVQQYALLTLHRPANVDNVETFREIVEGLQDLAATIPIVFPVHPRTQQSILRNSLGRLFRTAPDDSTVGNPPAGVLIINPLGYLDFLCLMNHSCLVITDSGGIQEETTCLGVPCVTVRENTERPVTVEVGTNILAGVRRNSIRRAIQLQRVQRRKANIPDKWDGHAAERIVDVMKSYKRIETGRVSDYSSDPTLSSEVCE